MAQSSYSASGVVSTFRWISVALLLVGTSVWADPPQFSTGGFLFGIQYGPGFWGIDRTYLAASAGGRTDVANAFVDDAQNTHTVSLSMAYNIKGHASIGADFTATGWNVFDSTRGGAGFLIGKVAWHPLELVWMNKQQRPIPLDLSFFFGAGYGIAGHIVGLDGLVLETGLNVDWFFTRYFGLGLFARFILPQWDKLYVDYNNRSDPGNTIPLSKKSGGSFITIGLTLTFRAGD